MSQFEIAAQAITIALAIVGLFFAFFELYLKLNERKPRIKTSIYRQVKAKKMSWPDEKRFHGSFAEWSEWYRKQPKMVIIKAENVGSKPVYILVAGIYSPDYDMPLIPNFEFGSIYEGEEKEKYPIELMPWRATHGWISEKELIRYLKSFKEPKFEGKVRIRGWWATEIEDFQSTPSWADRLRISRILRKESYGELIFELEEA